jgi:hypothetical protein
VTKKSPRIYVYKITFLEVPHYYYGVHKEKVFNEYYVGSPKTNKDFWVFYTPMKSIVKEFPFTDKDWLAAKNFEDSLIEPVYNTDPLCLNNACRGKISLEICRRNGQKNKENGTGVCGLSLEKRIEAGKKGSQKHKENGTGFFAMTPEEKKQAGRKGVQTQIENGIGIFGFTDEQRKENGRKGGKITHELGIGLHGRSKEKMSEDGKKAGKKCYELGVGVHARTKEEMREHGKRVGKRGGKISGQKHKENKTGVCGRSKEKMSEDGRKAGKIGSKVTNLQKWQCTVTGYVSNSGGLSMYQKARGIDTSNRIRIK